MEQLWKAISTGLFITIMISACLSEVSTNVEPSALPEPTIMTAGVTPDGPASAPVHIYTTQNNLLGNHLVEGSTDLENASIVDVPLSGVPLWLVSAPWEDSVIFIAVLQDGQTQAFTIREQTYESLEISPVRLPAGMPPLLAISDDHAQLVIPPQDASLLSNPILIEGGLVYIAANGDVVFHEPTSNTRLPIDALPDARILKDENERLLVLTGPTNRYDHGVLGDDLEASGITLIETKPEPRLLLTIPIEAPDVIEGISAIWADLDNDGIREIIVTLSNDQSGARIAAFREDGSLLAEGAAVGLGHRWRHQIAVASFEPEATPLILGIRTPHIGGVVEFYQYSGQKLEIMKEVTGFSAHSIGSRNLDSAIVSDFNNDGISELLVPDQSHTNLAVISIDGLVMNVPLDSVLTTNLSAAVMNGKLFIGAGTSRNLRIWIP